MCGFRRRLTARATELAHPGRDVVESGRDGSGCDGFSRSQECHVVMAARFRAESRGLCFSMLSFCWDCCIQSKTSRDAAASK